MDFITGRIKTLYFKYFAAAFGSTLVTSIYSLVDIAMVGQYYGPEGSAALAVVAPVWNIIYSLGMLTGIGGSVIFSTIRGRGDKHDDSNEYFTASVIYSVILGAAVWLLVAFFDKELLVLFGAKPDTLGIACNYVFPIKFAVPLFLFNQMLIAYVRNDKNPTLATVAVMAGGIFNIFGDYTFVFVCDMGAFGAGLATAIGSAISFVALLTHFLRKKNTLKIVRVSHLPLKIKKIAVTGFSTFFTDVSMGIFTILFNRQIGAYLGTNELAVYGVIVQIANFVQCCAYSVGQAAQPIISANFGAGRGDRIHELLKYALGSALFFAILWTALCMAIPNAFIRVFMSPTSAVLQMAPGIFRRYGISFLLLPLNIFSTYYFQAILRPKTSFLVSVGRGLVISGIMIYLLPIIAGADAIWFAMPITEAIVAVYVVYEMKKITLPKRESI